MLVLPSAHNNRAYDMRALASVGCSEVERIQSDAHGRRRRCVEKRERELKSKAVSIAKQLKNFKSVFIVMKRPSCVERDAETETRVAHLKSSSSFVCGSGS